MVALTMSGWGVPSENLIPWSSIDIKAVWRPGDLNSSRRSSTMRSRTIPALTGRSPRHLVQQQMQRRLCYHASYHSLSWSKGPLLLLVTRRTDQYIRTLGCRKSQSLSGSRCGSCIVRHVPVLNSQPHRPSFLCCRAPHLTAPRFSTPPPPLQEHPQCPMYSIPVRARANHLGAFPLSFHTQSRRMFKYLSITGTFDVSR